MADDSVRHEDFEIFKEIFNQAIIEENFEVQINMMKRLGILAEHIGEEITRKELLPFLKEHIELHDEILFNLSDQLKQFIPLVGGYEHSQPVLDILQKICATDETIVREKTVETLRTIADNLNSELTEKFLIPLFETLGTTDWFTSKCSAVALFPIIYPKVKDEKKQELRHTFRLLSQDESPIVRKSAAICLIDLISIVDKNSLINEFVSVFDNIAKDSSESVKMHAVKLSIQFSKKFTETEIEEFILKHLEELADAESWKVRQIIALHIAEIQEVIWYPKLRGKILAIFQKLLKDQTVEVKIVAIGKLVNYCRNLKISYEKQNTENNFEHVFLQSILPQITYIVTDFNEEVKLVLSKNILSISSIISKDMFTKHVMPLIVDILEMESTVSVKAGILENLHNLPKDIDVTQSLLCLKKVVRTLIVHSQSLWRTRNGLLIPFMHIASFASKEYFCENLKIFYASLLGDPVFAVRRTAPIILPLLAQRYGMTWAVREIMPYFKMFVKDTRYLYRYVPLFGINELINPSIITDESANYLNSLKSLEKSYASKALYKLKILVNKLKTKLDENTFKDILSLNKSIDDFKNDHIVLYAGDTINNIRQQYTQDIFAYNIETGDDWYLTDLIILIYRDFLNLILLLFDDRIVNVQIRSIFTLNKIKVFIDTLLKELDESWVTDTIKLISKEESDKIETEVALQLKEKSVEIDEEKIDTELMENIFASSETVLIQQNSEIPEMNIGEFTNEKVITEIGDNESILDLDLYGEDAVNTDQQKFEETIVDANIEKSETTAFSINEEAITTVSKKIEENVEITENIPFESNEN